MNRQICSMVLFVGASFAVTTAQGADLPLLYKAAPATTWSGYFVGGHIGLGQSSAEMFDIFPVPDGVVDADTKVKGWLGGVQAGYNLQVGQWLVGVGSDFSWSGVKGSFSCFPFGDQQCTANADWFATVTGRAGLIFGQTLLYVKGGAAWVHNTYTDTATCAGSQPRSSGGIPALCGDTFAGTEIRSGWTVGAGVDYRLGGPWSLSLEYDFMDFGQRPVVFLDGLGNRFPEDVRQRVSIVRAGVNYHFGAGLTPLAADDERPSRLIAFTGVDVAKKSVSGWAGGMVAPWGDMDTSGLRVWLFGELGTYKYSSGGDVFRGVHSSGDLMAGYSLQGNNYAANLLAGLNAINHTITPYDFDNKVQGTQGGAKVRGDLWVNPTPQTFAYGEAEYSTAFKTFYVSGKVGLDVTAGKEVFVGPLVAVLGDERFNQWRVGAHMTQIRFGPLQMDLAAGFAKDSIVGTGAFSKLELSANF